MVIAGRQALGSVDMKHQKITVMNDPKAQITALLKSIETSDSAAAVEVDPNKYIQHNLTMGDDLPASGPCCRQCPKAPQR